MKVVIYGKPDCPNCVKAKDLLASKPSIETEYIDIIEAKLDAIDLGVICGTAVRSVPLILIDGKYIGGFSNLVPLVKAVA